MAPLHRLHRPSLQALTTALRGWGVSRSEAVALVLLAAAALAGLGLLWLATRPGDPLAVPGSGDATVATPDPSGEGAAGGLDVRRGTVVVHVAGHVGAPGLYELPGGARVADALAAAGGPLDGAPLDHLNLARPLADGEQLRVPGPGEAAPAPGGGAGPAPVPSRPPAWRPDGTLDLNQATAADLQELPGIGPVLAERVVAFREQHGPFTSPGQLRQVPGIGERTFQGLADLVSL